MSKCKHCLYHNITAKCGVCIHEDLYSEKYEFFTKGPYSQWTKHPMVDPLTKIEFNCCEQYMMYKKAMLFGDDEIAARILSTSNPREQKTLGRQVKNYNQVTWDAVKFDIVFTANVLKFSQNKNIRETLLSTGDKILVEAAPWDKIWGIGINEEEARKTDPAKWPGLNLLGQAVTSVKKLYK